VNSITKEQLALLPIVRYEGPVTVVSSVHDLERAGQSIRRETIVGFDTETRPAFHKGQSYTVSLVQIATAHTVFLFQLSRLDCAGVLTGVLENTAIIKAGIALADDLLQLKRIFPFVEKNMVDLGTIAQRQGFQQTGVRNLAGLLLGRRITKGAQTSNWASPQLSPKQITYAATDAWICRELYLRFDELGLLESK
jgi:ribonuclease D